MSVRIFSYLAPDVVTVESRGHQNWVWGDRREWFVGEIDGQIVGRRRTREKVVEMLRSKQVLKAPQTTGAR